jgi:hypothetical protein
MTDAAAGRAIRPPGPRTAGPRTAAQRTAAAGTAAARTAAARTAALALLALTAWLGSAPDVQARPALYAPPICPTVSFRSEPRLGAQRLCMNLGVRSRGTPSGNYLFLTPNSLGAGIFAPNGTLVWWQSAAAGTHEHDAKVVHLGGHAYLAVWSGGASELSGSAGKILLLNQHYTRVGVITAGAPYQAEGVDLHDFRITPQGDALIGIDDPIRMTVGGHSATVVQYVVQKLSLVRDSTGIHTGRVLFEWNSLRDVPVSQSHYPPPGSGIWDYFHGNAVAQDFDGNLLVSARNTWGIYKISIRTGHLIWEVGGKGDHTLGEPWCFQHDVAPLGHDRYSLFDDGGDGPGCAPHAGGHAARGLIVRVTPSTVPGHPAVKLVHAYLHAPPIGSDWMGSMQQLSDGNVLVGWGTTPELTEFSADGRRMALDLSVSFQSYRALSFPWVGQPLTPPSVAALADSGGTDLWASWNGSTQVTAWRVLAGSSRSALRPVTARLPRRGFETRIRLARRYRYVAVQAIGRSGGVLSRSAAVTP